MERKSGSIIDIEAEIEFMELGMAARGAIEAGPDQQERFDEVTERVGRGEFHKEIDWDHELKLLIARCVDGRSLEDGEHPLAPNAAGGSESLLVADDLTTGRYAAEDGTTAGGYANLLADLQKRGYVVGGHTDTHAEGEKSGCGANDKLPAIYQYIYENSDLLQVLAEKIGVDVPDEVKQAVAEKAAARSSFSEGAALYDELKKRADEQFIDRLGGGHSEVVAVINKRAGTTLDRAALAAEFGEEYQAFNVDAWAFEEAARAIAVDANDEAEVAEKVAAMTFYNLATTLVLAGPKMRVVVIE